MDRWGLLSQPQKKPYFVKEVPSDKNLKKERSNEKPARGFDSIMLSEIEREDSHSGKQSV